MFHLAGAEIQPCKMSLLLQLHKIIQILLKQCLIDYFMGAAVRKSVPPTKNQNYIQLSYKLIILITLARRLVLQ